MSQQLDHNYTQFRSLKSRHFLVFFIAMFALFLANVPSFAAAPPFEPRFATVKHPKVKVRVGPSYKHPIRWMLVRSNFPVKIVDSYDHWRKIQDWRDTEGWVHKNDISENKKRRTIIVRDLETVLRSEPSAGAAIEATLERDVVAFLEKCQNGWCRVKVQDHRGWVFESSIWGVGQRDFLG